ncbi:MAG: N-6 DNA methylase [Clostridia bacterium]
MSRMQINPKYKKIIDLLDFSNGKYDIVAVFRDFVIMFAIAIKNKFLYNQEDENIYLQIIKKYDKSETKVFIKLISELIFLYTDSNEIRDVLGEIFEQIGASSKRNEQYFTPSHIAGFMNEIVLSSEELKKEKYITVADCACGSGVMILNTANSLNKKGINYQEKLIVECQDIDFICFCMTYIQISLYGIVGRVIFGNTLLNEKRKIFYTPQYFIGKWYEKLQ